MTSNLGDWDFRPIQVKGFSNTLVLKDYYNKLRIKGAKFGVYDAVRRDVTKYVHKHLNQVIERGLNLIGMIIGKGGEGKSLIALDLAKRLKDAQIKYNRYKDSPVRFTYNIDESKKAFKYNPNGTIVIQDEYNELVGESSQTTKTEFNNIVRTFRFTQKCFIVCNVNYIHVKGLHFVLETFGFDDSYFSSKDHREMRTVCLVRYIDDNHPKTELYLGIAIIEVNEVLEQYKKSLILKQKNWKSLIDSSGAVSSKMRKEERLEYANKLLKIAKKGNWNGKLKTLNIFFQDAKISCDTYQKKMILEETIKLYKKDLINADNDFDSMYQSKDPLANFFEEFYVKNLNKKDFENHPSFTIPFMKKFNLIPKIAFYYAIGESFEKITNNLNAPYDFVRQIMRIFSEKKQIPAKYQFGYVFELYLEKILANCFHGGKKGEPDLFFKYKKIPIGCGEVKLYGSYRKTITLYLESEDPNRRLKPSYDWCKANDIRFFPLFLRVFSWENIYMIPIDIEGDNSIKITRFICESSYILSKYFNPIEFFSPENQDALIGNAINSG